MAGDDKKRRRFHFRRQAAEFFPGLPFIEQITSHRLRLRRMLAVERILALHHTHMMRQIQRLRRLHERIRHVKIGDSRKFDRRIFTARALHADGAGRDDNVAAFHIQLHTAAGAHAHKGVGASHHELLQRDRRRRSTDACRGDTDFFAVEHARVGHKLAAVGDELRIVKIRRDLRTALGIARQEHIAPNVPAPHLQMIKFFLIFRIIDHEITSFRMITSIPENPPRNLTKIAKKKSSPRRTRFSVVFIQQRWSPRWLVLSVGARAREQRRRRRRA